MSEVWLAEPMSMQWAVVTGASGGLGEEFARRLASQGANVMLVARSEEKLAQLARELEQKFGITARAVPCDLSEADSRAPLVEKLSNTEVHTVVNNAGFGTIGKFAELSPTRINQEISLNIAALTELTRAVLPGQIARGRGAVINVASTGAFQPIPKMAVYAASKAYVLRFTSALWAELRGTGVRAVCICPGPTRTQFFAAAGNDSVMTNRREPNQVVDATFAALASNQPYVVDGLRNNLLAQANRFAPTRLQLLIAGWIASH